MTLLVYKHVLVLDFSLKRFKTVFGLNLITLLFIQNRIMKKFFNSLEDKCIQVDHCETKMACNFLFLSYRHNILKNYLHLHSNFD